MNILGYNNLGYRNGSNIHGVKTTTPSLGAGIWLWGIGDGEGNGDRDAWGGREGGGNVTMMHQIQIIQQQQQQQQQFEDIFCNDSHFEGPAAPREGSGGRGSRVSVEETSKDYQLRIAAVASKILLHAMNPDGSIATGMQEGEREVAREKRSMGGEREREFVCVGKYT